jgi:hypothetical protein
MNPIHAALSRVILGEPAHYRNMTVFPLFTLAPQPPRYLLLAEALERNLARVAEVSEAGAVPELLFVNEADEKILLVDGEELVGARQNRILNVTLLVGGGQKVVIPVSCVEQGRWAYKSRRFESSDRTLFTRARAKKARQVTASLRESGSRYANQAEIWRDISDKAERLRVQSETEAMSDIYEEQSARIEDYVKAFAPQSAQAGALFAVNGRIAGLELFDSAATFRRFMPKIVRGYAIDAIEESAADAKPPVAEAVRCFFDEMQVAALERFPALAEGEDLRIESDAVAGGALYAESRIVHLCAFAVEEPASRPLGRGGRIDFEVPAFLRRARRERKDP